VSLPTAATRRTLVAGLAGALALMLAGCVALPQGGPVQSGPRQEQVEQIGAPFDYSPDGPRADATQLDVVGGFLLAMQATPLSTAVARQFLTDEASTRWVPEGSTVVYGSESLEGQGKSVTVALTDTVQLDGRGEWLGDNTGGRGIQHRLRLVREAGEWRITNPPDALVLPRTYFETRFEQYFLYFFDKSGQILSPEPVYLPQGEQSSTLLVRGLLKGPAQDLLGATRTFIPAKTELDDLSVLVSSNGTAEVPLSDEVLDLDDEDLGRVLGQLGWTLRQVPGVETMRITVDGSPLDVPGEGVDLDVQGWPEFDPSVNWASGELFGIRDGRLVTLAGNEERRAEGLFGTKDYGLRSIAVDLPAEQVAGVSGDGDRVLVTPRSLETGQARVSRDADVVYSGAADLLQPSWDIYGQVWLVDQRREGATLAVVRSGVATELEAGGITGERVNAFLISRDGTRLVAVIAGEGRDRLVVARVMRREDGTVRGVSRVTLLPTGALGVSDIRDLAWRTPGSVALLTGPTPGLPQVVVALIDGSSARGDADVDAEIFGDEAARIVTSPASGAPVYVGTTGRELFELTASGRWTGAGIEPGLGSPTFVG